jgi:hypothetical protein
MAIEVIGVVKIGSFTTPRCPDDPAIRWLRYRRPAPESRPGKLSAETKVSTNLAAPDSVRLRRITPESRAAKDAPEALIPPAGTYTVPVT